MVLFSSGQNSQLFYQRRFADCPIAHNLMGTHTQPATIMYPILHMCAKNDYYGNPQRLYVMSDDEGKFIQCWDEGYNGYHAVPEELRNEAYLAQRVNVSVTKYKQLLRTLPTSKVSKESFLKVAS